HSEGVEIPRLRRCAPSLGMTCATPRSPFTVHRSPLTPCAEPAAAVIYNHMVVHKRPRPRRSDAQLDRLFRALADRTRRDIVARVLAGEEASVSTLAARYAMSFAAVQKHVAVLAEAGLVTKRARGRERMVRGNPKELA